MGFKDDIKKAVAEERKKKLDTLDPNSFKAKALMKEQLKYEQEEKINEQIKDFDAQGIPYCPKCKSSSVQYLDRRKRLSVGRAIVGGAVTLNPLGAAVGAVTSKKHNGVMKCLKCGNEWKLK